MTQLICVIHNPILIYKLSKLEYINFIELTDVKCLSEVASTDGKEQG